MKKTILVIAILGMAFLSNGQAKIELGLKAGANFANTDAGDVSTETITSFNGGFFTLIKLANIGIQPEILWSKQGSEISFGTVKEDLDLSYVNIPVMLKFYLPLGLNLQAGPQFGILTNETQLDFDADGAKDALEGSDLSAAFGAGWDAPFGLKFDVRYVLGLTDISPAVATESIKNRTFQVSVGYRLFKLGK